MGTVLPCTPGRNRRDTGYFVDAHYRPTSQDQRRETAAVVGSSHGGRAKVCRRDPIYRANAVVVPLREPGREGEVCDGIESKMKIEGIASLSCFLAVAIAAALREQKVSYDGYKVVRVSVGDELSHINDIVAELGLTTWKGAPKANSPADIVVPPAQVAAFHSRIDGLEAVTMHEDLGASMKAEGSYESYAGTKQSPARLPNPRNCLICSPQLDPRI